MRAARGIADMYESHFGLQRRPFRPTPDADAYYPATTHEQALAQLLQALTDEEAVLLLTGVPGTGKTLLCHGLLDRLAEGVATAFLTNSHFRDRAGLLQAIMYDLGLPYEGRSEQELRLAVTDALLATYTAGRRTVLLVDEAQDLTADVLEELRLLGNLESRQGKALQVILVAQPGLLETVRAPELAAFSQRLAVPARLEPLGVHEAADYLMHQLRTAGGRPERLIGDEALDLLARGTGGIPRLLNRAAHQAFTLAHAAEAAQVDAEAVLEALSLLGLCVEGGEDAGDGSLALPAEAGGSGDPPGRAYREESDLDASPVLALDDDPPRDETTGVAPAADPGRLHRLFAPPRRPA